MQRQVTIRCLFLLTLCASICVYVDIQHDNVVLLFHPAHQDCADENNCWRQLPAYADVPSMVVLVHMYIPDASQCHRCTLPVFIKYFPVIALSTMHILLFKLLLMCSTQTLPLKSVVSLVQCGD